MFWALSVWAVAEFVARRNANWWLLAGHVRGAGRCSANTPSRSWGRAGPLPHQQPRARALAEALAGVGRRRWRSLCSCLTSSGTPSTTGQHCLSGPAARQLRAEVSDLSPTFAEYVAGQVLASGVFLFVFVVVAAVLFARHSELPGREQPCAASFHRASPILIYFAFYCLRFRAEANWPLVAWPMLSLAGAWAMVHFRPQGWLGGAMLALFRRAQVPLGIALTMLIYVQAVWQPWSIGRPSTGHATCAAGRGFMPRPQRWARPTVPLDRRAGRGLWAAGGSCGLCKIRG
jgi:hypothetical protein